ACGAWLGHALGRLSGGGLSCSWRLILVGLLPAANLPRSLTCQLSCGVLHGERYGTTGYAGWRSTAPDTHLTAPDRVGPGHHRPHSAAESERWPNQGSGLVEHRWTLQTEFRVPPGRHEPKTCQTVCAA